MVQAVVQTTVTGLQGNPISATAPTSGQSLTWSGSAWAPAGPFVPTTGGVMTGGLTVTGINVGTLAAYGSLAYSGTTLTIGVNGTLQLSAAATITTGSLTVDTSLGVNGNASVLGAMGISGTLNVGGVLSSTSGRIISEGAGSNPSVVAWDTTPGAGAFGFWAAGILYFGQMNNMGVPITNFGAFDLSGNLSISGTLTQGSDATNKTNIAPLSEGISLIRQLIPKSFAWNSSPNTTQWGFIAQDVEGVIPSAVTHGPPPLSGGTTGLLSLDITGILAAVTFAMKQIDQRLSAVEAHDGITPPAAQLA